MRVKGWPPVFLSETSVKKPTGSSNMYSGLDKDCSFMLQSSSYYYFNIEFIRECTIKVHILDHVFKKKSFARNANMKTRKV